MVVMPLVQETKMADVGKLTSLGNLVVRKITWFVLTSTSATLIWPSAFGDELHDKYCLYILSSSENSLSYTVTYRDSSLSLSLSLSLSRSLSHSYILTSSSQPHENVYILQPFSLLFCLFS